MFSFEFILWLCKICNFNVRLHTFSQHLSGGSVIEVRPTGADSSNSFGSVNYLTQSKTFEQQPFSQSPYVDVKAGLQQDFSDVRINTYTQDIDWLCAKSLLKFTSEENSFLKVKGPEKLMDNLLVLFDRF